LVPSQTYAKIKGLYMHVFYSLCKGAFHIDLTGFWFQITSQRRVLVLEQLPVFVLIWVGKI